MKKKKMSWFLKGIIIVAVFLFFAGIAGFMQKSGVPKASQESVLALNLKGVLVDKQKFLKELRHYSKDEKIKGVLIRMDSPGGSVAVSQELYHEFKRIRETLQKPVVVSVGSMMASGALYAAAGASTVLVNSGTLVGSIGVIFPHINMERLYEWAKIEPYSIKTGEFKDAGADFRSMTSRERILFQDIANELLDQFKSAIMEGRKMRHEDLEPYTDARIFTGEVAVSAGFADSVGTYSDAIELVGEMSGLGKTPKLFTPQPSYFDLFSSHLGDTLKGEVNLLSFLEKRRVFLSLFEFYNGQPLYIFPSAIGM